MTDDCTIEVRVDEDPVSKDPPVPVRVMFVDPGLAHLAIVVLDITRSSTRCVRREHVESSKADGDDLSRLDTICRRILGAIAEDLPDVIGYENQAGMSGHVAQNASSRRLLEVCGMIRMACVDRGIPLHVVAAELLKATVIGKGGGRAKKMAIKARIQTLLGWGRCNEHECDAAAGAYATYNKHMEGRRKHNG